jgi:hypothetical protein
LRSNVLYVCGLFNVAANSSDPMLFSGRMVVTSALKMMLKEAVRLCRNCLPGLRKTTRNLVMVVALESVVYTVLATAHVGLAKSEEGACVVDFGSCSLGTINDLLCLWFWLSIFFAS